MFTVARSIVRFSSRYIIIRGAIDAFVVREGQLLVSTPVGLLALLMMRRRLTTIHSTRKCIAIPRESLGWSSINNGLSAPILRVSSGAYISL